MKRLAIPAGLALAIVAALLATHGLSGQAQPVANITLPEPGGLVQLYPGCNNISLTFENGTPSDTVVQAVTPAAVVQAMWRHNAALGKFEGFSPAAPQASDLLTVDFLDSVWLCLAGAPPTAAPVPLPHPTPVPPPPPTLPPPPPTNTPVPTPPPPPAPAPVPPSLPSLPDQIPDEIVVQTCIDGTFTGWSGYTAFALCNGQVWMQSSYSYWYHYAYRPNVLIYRTGLGYRMQVEGVSVSVYVTPVNDFIRTCIDGDFEGWEGDTVFALCNGQVWMQSSYSYWYHYAYRPRVLIYQTGFGYRMQVEGLSETVAVVRLS